MHVDHTAARTTYRSLRAARVRAVGTRFLQLRPWIAGVAATVSAGLLASSGAPRHQLVAMGLSTGLLVVAFAVEAAALARHPLTERWLLVSLAATAVAIGIGCAFSGGARSPMLPLVFAPVVIAFAAFARGRAAWLVSVIAVLVVALVALDPLKGVMPQVAAPHAGWMALVAVTAALVLARIGVTGLADAYQSAGESAARMRDVLLKEAATRSREADAMGARVAHEVRNPLTSIKGLVQLLRRHERDEKNTRRLEVVLEEVARVESILEDYLAFARPPSELEVHPVEVHALLEETRILVEGEAAASAVAVVIEGEPAQILADPRRVREALLNLARNAIAAMPDGGTLTFRLACDADAARIEVVDDGQGMDEATLARIGTPYFTTRSGGTGLGVTMASSAIRQHGGQLRYESTPGAGTTAHVVLPREARSEEGP